MCVSLCAHIVGTAYWLLPSVYKLNLITWPASPAGGPNTAVALFILIALQDPIHPVVVSKGIQLLTYLYVSGIRVGYLMNHILPHHLLAEQTYEEVALIIPILHMRKTKGLSKLLKVIKLVWAKNWTQVSACALNLYILMNMNFGF